MTLVDPPFVPPSRVEVPPLEAGDHLDQSTFMARYEAMPVGTRAELIGGIVYMPPPPVGEDHFVPHADVVYWVSHYKRFTPGVQVINDGTVILGDGGVPQPDAGLRIVAGGQTRLNARRHVVGCPELLVEVANSTEAYDLHAKRDDYDRFGVREYVAAVIRTRRVVWFARDQGRLVEVPPDPDGIHRSRSFPGLWLDPAALLRDDLNRLAAVVEAGMATAEHAAFVADLSARQP